MSKKTTLTDEQLKELKRLARGTSTAHSTSDYRQVTMLLPIAHN